MSSLAEMMAKARRAVMRRGVSAADADELVHDAFIKVEQYERAHAAESKEALLVTAAVNLSIDRARRNRRAPFRSEEHTSELQSLMRISYAVFCLKQKTKHTKTTVQPVS